VPDLIRVPVLDPCTFHDRKPGCFSHLRVCRPGRQGAWVEKNPLAALHADRFLRFKGRDCIGIEVYDTNPGRCFGALDHPYNLVELDAGGCIGQVDVVPLERLQLTRAQPGVKLELEGGAFIVPAGRQNRFALCLAEGLNHVVAGLAVLSNQLGQGNLVKRVAHDKPIIEGIFKH